MKIFCRCFLSPWFLPVVSDADQYLTEKPLHFLLPSTCPVINVFELQSSSRHVQEPRACGWQQSTHHVNRHLNNPCHAFCHTSWLHAMHKSRQNFDRFYIFSQHFCQCITDPRFKEAAGYLSYNSSFTWSCLQGPQKLCPFTHHGSDIFTAFCISCMQNFPFSFHMCLFYIWQTLPFCKLSMICLAVRWALSFCGGKKAWGAFLFILMLFHSDSAKFLCWFCTCHWFEKPSSTY